VATSQKRTVPSVLALASMPPSGQNTTPGHRAGLASEWLTDRCPGNDIPDPQRMIDAPRRDEPAVWQSPTV